MNIIVGKTAGFCLGVKRAVEGALDQIKNNDYNKSIYCLGEIVHNKQVVNKLEKKGIKFINNINEVNNRNSNLIIRAHGVQIEEYKFAKEKQIEISDYTCPFVLKIHKIADEYKEKGFYIFVIGNKSHPEIVGTSSHCGYNYSIIEDEKDIKEAVNEFIETQNNNLLIIVQTTFNKEKFSSIVNNIKDSLNSNTNIVIKNTICGATEERQNETEAISKKVELMIVIGGKNSSNTKKLYEIAKKNTEAILIETYEELNIENIKKYQNIGIMAGASTPHESIENVIREFYMHPKLDNWQRDNPNKD